MEKARDRYVYIYEDIGGTPFYVGVGKGDRMWHHIRRAHYDLANGRSAEKAAFIVRNMQFGGPPAPYKIAENMTITEAMEIEVDLIKQLGRRDLGTGPLFNKSAGGAGVKNLSESTRQKQSRSQVARWTEEDRMAWGERKRVAMTPEIKAVISNKMKAFCQSTESRKSRSDGSLLRWNNPLARKQQSARMAGHEVTQETRAKIGGKAKLRMSSSEARRKQSGLTKSQMSQAGAKENLSAVTASQWADPENRAKKDSRIESFLGASQEHQ